MKVKVFIMILTLFFVVTVHAEGISGNTNNSVQLSLKERFFQLSLFPGLSTDNLAQGPFNNHFVLGVVSKSDSLEGWALGLAYVGNGKRYNGWATSLFNDTSVFKGWQLSGLVNYTGKEFQGFQLAPFNFAMGDGGSALQLGGVNYSGGTLRGVQISLINIADNINGAQIGFINVAKKVHGVQIGFVNLADESDASIGLSFVKKGIFHFDFLQDFNGFTTLSLSMGGKYIYAVGQLGSALLGGVVSSPFNEGDMFMSVGLGIRLPFKNWFVKIENQIGDFYERDLYSDITIWNYKVYCGLNISHSTSLVLGVHQIAVLDADGYTVSKIAGAGMGVLSPFVGVEIGW